MATFTFRGSLTQNIQATRRNLRRHTKASVTAAQVAYYEATQGRRGRIQIPVDTGATRNSANPWVGRASFRKVPRGPTYPARARGVARRTMKRYKLGQRVGVSVQHPGGLLVFPGFSKKAPQGFHEPALAEAEKAYANFPFKPVGPKR